MSDPRAFTLRCADERCSATIQSGDVERALRSAEAHGWSPVPQHGVMVTAPEADYGELLRALRAVAEGEHTPLARSLIVPCLPSPGAPATGRVVRLWLLDDGRAGHALDLVTLRVLAPALLDLAGVRGWQVEEKATGAGSRACRREHVVSAVRDATMKTLDERTER